MLPSGGGAPSGGSGYRLQPDGARTLLLEIELQAVDRAALAAGFDAALGAIKNVDDVRTAAIIDVLSGIAGDLRDLPARLDSRVEAVVGATRVVVAEIDGGDAAMAADVGAAHQPYQFASGNPFRP